MVFLPLLPQHGDLSQPLFIGGLPIEASVIATTFDDGSKVWQRPVNGIAIFDNAHKQCVQPTDEIFCDFEFTVFDAQGNEITRLVSD